tara:strand:+ start:3344 stop:4270 length:927 start_codon:yes stop_codon:yes gene_type:complete
MEMKKITILLATHNRAHLIGETLQSIKNQTYTNFECLITDDNSTDNTAEVVENVIKEDTRFLYFKKPKKYPKGLSATRNFGLDIATTRNAEYIQFFDDDDIMHPQKLELQIIPLINNSKLDFTLCKYRKFDFPEMIELDLQKADDKSCKIFTKNLLKSFYLNELDLNSLGPLWKAEVILNYRFNELLHYTEERDLYLRMFLQEKIKYKAIPYILFWYRKHPNAITSNFYGSKTNIKEKSRQISEVNFFKILLNKEKVPFFLLKSFLAKGIKQNKKEYLTGLKVYILKNYRWLNVKYLAVLFYLHLKLK